MPEPARAGGDLAATSTADPAPPPASPRLAAALAARAESRRWPRPTRRAAAAYYLGYTFYKIGEPSRRMNANKEKAKELFAKAFSLDPAFSPTWGK
jgi:hypothetical protein